LDESNLEYHGLIAQMNVTTTVDAALDDMQERLTADYARYQGLVKENDDLWMDLAGIEHGSDFRKTLNDYNDDSIDNFFVIVMDAGSFDDEDEDFASDENGLLEYWDCDSVDYDVKNIVWYKAKKDGKPVIIEGAPVPNALMAA
jgi:hypothetical protein